MPAPITPVGLPVLPPVPAAPAAGTGGAFGSVFRDAVDKVEQFRLNAEQSVERFLAGEGEELHQTVLATQKAEMAFELFLQVRNKVVQAYQEIMRTQV